MLQHASQTEAIKDGTSIFYFIIIPGSSQSGLSVIEPVYLKASGRSVEVVIILCQS